MHSIKTKYDTCSETKTVQDCIDIYTDLNQKGIQIIDMVFWGNVILKKAKGLSCKVEKELIHPLRNWINDPDWQLDNQNKIDTFYNWNKYKKGARKWDKQQKQLSCQRLQHYLKFIRSEINKKKEISQWLDQGVNDSNLPLNCRDDFLSPIIKIFSRNGRHKEILKQQFSQIMDVSDLHRYPWRVMVSADIKNKRLLSEIDIYIPENNKKDKAFKLITLLPLNRLCPLKKFRSQL
jgi:hypothetical protein